ncbi:hypothetical protein KEH51_15775 [[Brevibacterium] frigoritolerans]|uniref:Uncharacterized protein n=1 Tax=Peribacillus frigoritolerans TaxID=450367 RepID=A0A941FHZ8_9BACI|nr:hypothetical protein [Peribacillus frigoritolerans]
MKELYESTDEEKVRLSCLKVLMEATKLPRKGNYNEEIEVLVLENIDDVIDSLSQQYEHYKLKEIKVLDGNIHRLIKEYSGVKSLEKLKMLELRIINNPDYGVFKTLVGYDLSNSTEIGWREVREQRKIKQLNILRIYILITIVLGRKNIIYCRMLLFNRRRRIFKL